MAGMQPHALCAAGGEVRKPNGLLVLDARETQGTRLGRFVYLRGESVVGGGRAHILDLLGLWLEHLFTTAIDVDYCGAVA